MRKTRLVSLVAIPLAVVGIGLYVGSRAWGQQPTPSLTGIVTSDAEGPMEGVLVGARAIGSTITTHVVSDSRGRYAFPAGRLRPGRYQLVIRATGYELGNRGPIEVGANGTSNADLKLQKAEDVLSQLQNGEVLLSIPGTPEQKEMLQNGNCVHCHAFQYALRTSYDENKWVSVLDRMRWHNNGSSFTKPTYNADTPPNAEELKKFWAQAGGGTASGPTASRQGDAEGVGANVGATAQERRPLASYLASITPWKYDAKTLPRPKGRATRVVMTEYDLPRSDAQPHDVIVGQDGTVWYSDFSINVIGRLNPQTGETKEYAFPAVRPNPPFAPGGLGLDFDSEGNIWFALMRQSAIAKLDVRTEKVATWAVPEPCWGPPTSPGQVVSGQVAPEPNGRIVWFKAECRDHSLRVFGINQNTMALVKTYSGGSGEALDGLDFYGFSATSRGDLLALNMGGSGIIEVTKETGKVALYPTPTPRVGPRRGELDAQGRMWYAGNRAGLIGMFDPATKQFKEYPVNVPGAEKLTDPYQVVTDRNGEAWSGGEILDYIYRLNPSTSEVTHYLLPTVDFNVRRMWDDSVPGRPVTIWTGSTHHAKVVRIEPLD